MCGIVGFTGAQEAAPLLLDGLKKLEYRGYDSAGIAVQYQGSLRMIKASGQIANLAEKTRDGAELPGCTGIGHTRWATHGAPTDVNAHPHMSNDGKFAIVHLPESSGDGEYVSISQRENRWPNAHVII